MAQVGHSPTNTVEQYVANQAGIPPTVTGKASFRFTIMERQLAQPIIGITNDLHSGDDE